MFSHGAVLGSLALVDLHQVAQLVRQVTDPGSCRPPAAVLLLLDPSGVRFEALLIGDRLYRVLRAAGRVAWYCDQCGATLVTVADGELPPVPLLRAHACRQEGGT